MRAVRNLDGTGMMPAKTCKTCYHCGSLTYGPECRHASRELCCEDWLAPKKMRVRAVIEGEIDLTWLEQTYQEKFRSLSQIAEYGNVTEEQYILGLLQPDGLDEISITQIQQLPTEGEAYPEPPVRQREVIIA